jgi:hypothetical protein
MSDEDLQRAYGHGHKDGIHFDTRDAQQNRDGISVSNVLADKLLETGEWELMYEHVSETQRAKAAAEVNEDLAPATVSPEGSPAVTKESGQGRAK